MAGHSKWANIKHKKAAADVKRGKAFTRLSKEISVAARVGSGDPTANPRLRHLIDKARDLNMPTDNIARAIKRGTGELPGVHYEPILYEGYGPSGIAIMVETLTDNKNRTVAELRRLFSSNGGSLAENGAVSWMFNKLGVIRAHTPHTINEDQLLENLIEFDIKDIECTENNVTITCEGKALDQIKNKLKSLNFIVDSAELEWVAHNTTTLEGEKAEKAINFLDELEENEDVQNVYANLV